MQDSGIRQTAFVGRVQAPHLFEHTAFECFLPQGVLTLLPESENVYSFIWHVKSAGKKILQSLSPSDFVQLMRLYVPEIDAHALIGDVQSFSLAPSCARTFQRRCVYLCGDAAHSLHPLSGQSLNVFVEALRGLEAYLSRPDQYTSWSDIYCRAVHTLFKATTLIDNTLNSNRLLGAKYAVFEASKKLHLLSFVTDYILGGTRSLDRTHIYAQLAI